MSYKKDVMDIIDREIKKHHTRSHSKNGTKRHHNIDWYLDNSDESYK